MSAGLHISISAEPIAHIGHLAITNSVFTSLLASALLIIFGVAVKRSLKKTDHPTGLQNVAEWIIEQLYNLVSGIALTEKKTKQFFPFIATFFLFIICNNYFGLLPGVGTIGMMEEAEGHSVFVPLLRAGTADLNTTLALAVISMFMVQVFGVAHHKLGYFKKFITFSSPINFFVGILESVSELAKIISFAFRLFGNIFAGEVLLTVISFLVPIIAPMPFYGLELFVGFIQALVFAMLSLVFFNMAAAGHNES